jgi:cobyrinic acid a,c-diamide synthase
VVSARLVVAGTHSGVGKTTVATGLMGAFAARGHAVAGFKVGPDFIDPSYHALATGRPGRNLDAFLSGPDLIAPLFAHGAAGADLAIVEGVMGLFDGARGGGELASTAQVAKLLRAPVLLVVDCSAMARSVAALVHGFASFDPEVRLAGVVLNRVASERHEELLRAALDALDTPVLGVLRRRRDLATPERHLGLVPVAERRAEARRTVAELAAAVAAGCDLNAIAALSAGAPGLQVQPWEPAAVAEVPAPWDRGALPRRIAIASGPAFSFIYQENLELLEANGAELVAVDPTVDERLPEGSGALYLGGGFPETYAGALAANQPLRAAVRRFAMGGRPVVAECGGLLYLSRRLDGLPMCGVLQADGRMTDRLTLGYRQASAASPSPLAHPGHPIRGHEFHYSTLDPPAGAKPAWLLGDPAHPTTRPDPAQRPAGSPCRGSPAASVSNGRPEGFVAGGVHASFLHTHWAAFPDVPSRLVVAAGVAS